MFVDRFFYIILKVDGKFEMVEDFCIYIWLGNFFIGVLRF